ncbi:MAG: hypothetical protein CSA81_03880 [Acidobacteria bacterium]|nr:MAG: hypothetical protein CSA81_03880 [Acidobacteriota bacterium]
MKTAIDTLLICMSLIIVAEESTNTREYKAKLTQNESFEARLELAERLIESSQVKQALSHLEKIIKEMKKDGNKDSLKNRAKAYCMHAQASRMKMGQNPLSWMMGRSEYIENLKHAIELQPAYLDPYLELIGFYMEAPAVVGGSKDKALEIAYSLSPYHRKESLEQQFRIWGSKNNMKKQLQVLEEANNLFPDDDGFLLYLGLIQVANKDFPEAKATFNKGRSLKGENLPYHQYQSGKIRILMREDLETAITLFDQYIQSYQPERQPTRADALWRKGMAYELLDNQKEARVCYEEALKLNAEHKQAKEALKTVSSLP